MSRQKDLAWTSTCRNQSDGCGSGRCISGVMGTMHLGKDAVPSVARDLPRTVGGCFMFKDQTFLVCEFGS